MLRKVSILVFGLIVASLFFRCSDDFDKNDKGVMFGKKSHRQVHYLSGDKTQDVLKKFEIAASKSKKMKLFTKSGASQRSNVGTIDYSEIMEVIDTIGNVNYTFRVLNHPEDDKNTFHNLVLKEMGEEEFKILLIKYQHFDSNYKFNDNTTFKSINLTSSDPCDNEPIRIPGVGGSYDPDQPNPGSGGGGGDSSPQIDYSDCLAYLQVSCCLNTDGHFGNNKSCICPEGEKGYTILVNFCNPLNPSHTIVHSGRNMNFDPCGPDGDVGVLVPIVSSPCEELERFQKAYENQTINQYEHTINQLKIKAQGTNENGWAFPLNSNGLYGVPSVVPSVGSSVKMAERVGGNYVGCFHNHTNHNLTNSVPMFSALDVRMLRSYARDHNMSSNEKNYSVYFIGLVTKSENVYMLKIKDWNKIDAFFSSPKNLKDLDEMLMKKYTNLKLTGNFSQSNLEKEFLKILNQLDIGVGFFEEISVTNSDGSSEKKWHEITLDSNNNLIKNKC